MYYSLAVDEEDYIQAKKLFRAYAGSLSIDLAFQNFEKELDVLHDMYTLPHGGIILAMQSEKAVGCIAVRKIDDEIGELKRMYVKPAFNGLGVGKNLLEKALELAKDCHYKKLRLDTLDTMHPAISIYRHAGFYEIPSYYFNPNPNVIYFEKLL